MISVTLNGELRELDLDPDTPLLWVLRDHLGLTGTKYGCGKAECGACTVHLDGAPVNACVTPLSAVAGKTVTTIEVLSPDGRHPLQLAWILEEVPRCGYCQSGQLMAAAALLSETLDPPIPRSMPPCPRSCAAAGPTIGSATRSIAPPIPRLRMKKEPEAIRLTRRALLRIGALAGGGLVLELHAANARGPASLLPPTRRRSRPFHRRRPPPPHGTQCLDPHPGRRPGPVGSGAFRDGAGRHDHGAADTSLALVEQAGGRARPDRGGAGAGRSRRLPSVRRVLGVQATGESTSLRDAWIGLREAGAGRAPTAGQGRRRHLGSS